MFTIKHVNLAGDEFLVEAKQFLRERRSDGFIQYLAFDDNRHDYIASWCGDEHHERLRGTLDRHVLYVMNRFGSTVATHSFVNPDFSLACQADPEKLAA
jgi:hypothetical protein